MTNPLNYFRGLWQRMPFVRNFPGKDRSMPITDYAHPDYETAAPKWQKVRDACAGEDAIKAQTTRYLPFPGGDSAAREPHARERYAAYVQRAVYLNATGRTREALVGIAFANWPKVTLPTDMAVLKDDADGSGVGLINQAQLALSEVLTTGRAGLLPDFAALDPTTAERQLSRAELRALGMRPFLCLYEAEQILMWELRERRLSRLVLSESHDEYDGGRVYRVPQLRELIMVEGRCVVQLWRKYTENGEFHRVSITPTSFEEIPFTFIGSTNNNADPDQPPLLDLANVNIAHFRNSADNEESAFLVGQPQIVIAGIDQDWADKMGPIVLGSRAAITLPAGATLDLMQAQPNSLAMEAMRDKERMMAALGARLISPDASAKTATQSSAETTAAYSVLSLAVDNVSEAYRRALWLLHKTARPGAKPEEVDFAISTKFNELQLDANAVRETVAAWQAGILPQSDAWGVLRRLGVLDQGKTDEQVQGELDAQGPALDLDRAA